MYGKRFLALALALSAGVAAHAQVTFTVTTTPAFNALGYTTSQTVTFSFITGASFNGGGTTNFTGQNLWAETSALQNQLWSSVSATGLTGSYVRPGAPDTSILIGTDTTIALSLSSLSGSTPLGLSTPSTGQVTSISLSTNPSSGQPAFALTGSYVSPATYFNSYVGSYALSSGSISLQADTGFLSFSATNLTIAVAAVPEPSTYAAIAGVGVLGLAAWRRSRTRGTVQTETV